MKPIHLLLLMMLAMSCTSYYYVTTDVHRDLSVERKVHARFSDESDAFPYFASGSAWRHSKLDESFEVDFYDKVCIMTDVFECQCVNMDDLKYCVYGGHEDDPLLFPEEKVERRFRWFYTYHDYSALFRGLEERLPLPLDAYLDDNRKELFFRGASAPQSWNGIEMYLLLDDVNRKFAQWYASAVYVVMRDVYGPYCTAEQIDFMDMFREAFMERTERESLFAMEPDEFERKLADMAPDMGFGNIYASNAEKIDAAYEEKSVILDYFSSSFIYSMDMPGEYVDGNAADFIDGLPVWKVDAYRLLAGDLVLEGVFRKVNLWAFILTFALIAFMLQIFAKLFAHTVIDGKGK